MKTNRSLLIFATTQYVSPNKYVFKVAEVQRFFFFRYRSFYRPHHYTLGIASSLKPTKSNRFYSILVTPKLPEKRRKKFKIILPQRSRFDMKFPRGRISEKISQQTAGKVYILSGKGKHFPIRSFRFLRNLPSLVFFPPLFFLHPI